MTAYLIFIGPGRMATWIVFIIRAFDGLDTPLRDRPGPPGKAGFFFYRSSRLRCHRDHVGDNAGEYVADCGTEKG